jgi:hypothetical protein
MMDATKRSNQDFSGAADGNASSRRSRNDGSDGVGGREYSFFAGAAFLLRYCRSHALLADAVPVAMIKRSFEVE